MSRFIIEKVFGQGSFGEQCVLCGVDTYNHITLEHKEGCLYVAIRDEIQSEAYAQAIAIAYKERFDK